MMDIKKVSLIIAAALVLTAPLSGCGSENNSSEPSEVSASAVSSQPPKAEDVRRSIVGSWGRLGEVMHSFYKSGDCVIGGMYGSYEVEDDLTLVLTTTSGTRTEYVWNGKTEDYWRMEDDILTVNGNQFTKISDEPETIDYLN